MQHAHEILESSVVICDNLESNLLPLNVQFTNQEHFIELEQFYRGFPSDFNRKRSPEDMRDALGLGLYCIVREGGQIVAASGMFNKAGTQWIEFGRVRVAECAQGYGLQKRMLSCMITKGAAEGLAAERIWASCASDNEPSLRSLGKSMFRVWENPPLELIRPTVPGRELRYVRLVPESVAVHCRRVEELLASGVVARRDGDGRRALAIDWSPKGDDVMAHVSNGA